MPEVICKHER